MACVSLEGQGLGLARYGDSDVLIRAWSCSSLGTSFSMLDSDSGSTWRSQRLQAYMLFLVGNLSGNPSSSFHCHHRLRIEPRRLVRSCMYPWGRIKVLATPKPQRQSGEERNFSNAVTRSGGLGGWKNICALHDLPVLKEVQSVCGHTCDYVSDNSRCKGKFRAVR